MLVLGVISCAPAEPPIGPANETDKPPSPIMAMAPSLLDDERIAAALAKTEWVGRIHTDAMRELVARRKELMRGPGTPHERACRAVYQLVLKYAPQFDQAAGIARSEAKRREAVEAVVRSNERCAGSAAMSVFGAPAGTMPSASMLAMDDSVTGAFEPYVAAIESGVQSTDGSPSAVSSVVSGVLSGAAGIPTADLELVAGVGSVAIASSEEWSAVQGSGGFEGCNPEVCGYEMSVFSRGSVRRGPLAVIAAADAVGGIAGLYIAWVSGVREGSALINITAMSAAAASAMMFISFFL